MNNIKTLKFNKLVYRTFGTNTKKAEEEYKRCLRMKDAKKDKTPIPLLSAFEILVRRFLDVGEMQEFVFGSDIERKKYGYFIKLDTMHVVYALKLKSYDKFIVFHFFAEIDSPTFYSHIILDEKDLVLAEEQHLVNFEIDYIDD